MRTMLRTAAEQACQATSKDDKESKSCVHAHLAAAGFTPQDLLCQLL
jgi:hypothetical protein